MEIGISRRPWCVVRRPMVTAREVLLLINGHNKARALKECVEGGVNQMWTISALNLHNNAYIACDEMACGELRVDTYKYFLDVYRSERI